MFNLSNKIIIIAGGAGLIGSAFSEMCAISDATLIILDSDYQRGIDLSNRLKSSTQNEQIECYKCDLTNSLSVNLFLKNFNSDFENIDALVNCSYPRTKEYGKKKFEDVSLTDFNENIKLHLSAYFYITQQISILMMKQNKGDIINIASIYGFTAPRFEIYENSGMTLPVEYSLIKAGIINFTKYLASYLGKYNINVNSISPGGVFDNQPSSFVNKYSENVLIGKRMANLDDLVGILNLLLSDESNYITGQNFVVDGGFSL